MKLGPLVGSSVLAFKMYLIEVLVLYIYMICMHVVDIERTSTNNMLMICMRGLRASSVVMPLLFLLFDFLAFIFSRTLKKSTVIWPK